MAFKRQQQFEINWLWWVRGINPFYVLCFFGLLFHPTVRCVLAFTRGSLETKFLSIFIFDEDFPSCWWKERICSGDRASNSTGNGIFAQSVLQLFSLMSLFCLLPLMDFICGEKFFMYFPTVPVVTSLETHKQFFVNMKCAALDLIELGLSFEWKLQH